MFKEFGSFFFLFFFSAERRGKGCKNMSAIKYNVCACACRGNYDSIDFFIYFLFPYV